jgi:hypothetical protein
MFESGRERVGGGAAGGSLVSEVERLLEVAVVAARSEPAPGSSLRLGTVGADRITLVAVPILTARLRRRPSASEGPVRVGDEDGVGALAHAAVPVGAAPVPAGPIDGIAVLAALAAGESTATALDHEADAAAASALEAMPGGPELAALLAGLSPAGLGDAAVVETIAGLERVASWAGAVQARFVRELTDRHGTTDTAATRAAAEIGVRLGSSATVGSMKVNLAAALDTFPEVADALTTGRIDTRKATILAGREPGLSIAEHRRTVTALLAEAHRLTGPQLRARLRKAALTLNPDAAAERHKTEHAARQVTITPAPDAMAWVTAYIRADHAQRVKHGLHALTQATLAGLTDRAEDPRTIDQITADAFVDLFATVLDRGVDLAGHPLPHRARHALQVTVGAGTLLGLDARPAHLGGYGPIPADLARELAQDATWRALFTDAHGAFADLGTHRYRPGADLTRTVQARHITCTFPGCCRPAIVCDLDHAIEYDPAIAHLVKQTFKCNLHPLCRRHHNLKTSKHWRVRLDPDGTITWTVARTGHHYRRAPEPPAGAYPAPPDPWNIPDPRSTATSREGPAPTRAGPHPDDPPPF